MPKQNRDRRKKWYKGRRKTGAGGAEVRLRPTLQPGHIIAISPMNLEELPSIIEEARREENVLSQMAVLKACLERILQHMNPEGRPQTPHFEQIRTLRRLIFGFGDTLLIARTGFRKSLIFHAFSTLTGKITIQLVPL